MSPSFLALDSAMLVFSNILEVKRKRSKPDMYSHAHFEPGTWENWEARVSFAVQTSATWDEGATTSGWQSAAVS